MTKAEGRHAAPPPGTTRDEFLGGRIAVLQPVSGHRAGSDAVFLAASVAPARDARVLDAGSGVGVAGLCLLAREPGADITSVEIDAELCKLAALNAERNGVSERFHAVTADITAKADALQAAGLVREAYDEVMANPPFYREGSVRPAPNGSREAAHVMREGGLEAWVRFFATMAAPKGRLTLIHRPEALTELLPLIERSFGAIAIFPLFAKEGAPAARIILKARKGSREGLKLLPGLVLHAADGSYTEEAEAVLRHGAPLDIGG